jgi:hypothetical protein
MYFLQILHGGSKVVCFLVCRAVVFAIAMLGVQQLADTSAIMGILGFMYVIFSWYWTTQGELHSFALFLH